MSYMLMVMEMQFEVKKAGVPEAGAGGARGCCCKKCFGN